MSCYIVVFEVSIPETREKLEALLEKYNGYCPVTQDCWAILSEKTATAIRKNLASVLRSKDRLFVIRSGTAAAWQNSYGADHDKWLKDNL